MKKSLLLLCLFSIMGCSDEEQLLEKSELEMHPEPTGLTHRSVDEAKQLAISLFNDTGSDTRSLNVEENDIKDIDVFRFNHEMTRSGSYSLIDTLLYAVNFNQGSIIVTADKRLPPFIASFDKSNFYFNDLQKEENSAVLFLMEAIADDLLDYLEFITAKENSDPAITRATNYEDQDNTSLWRLNKTVSPKVQVAWHQEDPFNKYTPLYNRIYRSVLGCTAVAIGQAMTVLQPVTTYKGLTLNWSEMIKVRNSAYENTYPTQTDLVAKYLYAIGCSYGTSYGAESGADMDKAVSTTAKDFNYSYTTISTPGTIRDQLDKTKGLVLMSGYAVKKKTWIFFNHYKEGHAFIIDGYKDYTYVPYINSGYNKYWAGRTGYTVYNINLGWGTAYNGYYLGSFRYIEAAWMKPHIEEDPSYPALYSYFPYENSIFWKDDVNKEFNYKTTLWGINNK